MFDALTSKLQNAFRNLRGLGTISESNVADSLREVRMALLEADVNFKVVKAFIDRVRDRAVGQEVLRSLSSVAAGRHASCATRCWRFSATPRAGCR